MTNDDSPQPADRRDLNAPSRSFHPELAEAVAREAARDAENVAVFLRDLGFVPTVDRPVRLPPAFLLHLGAALRLWAWESSGLQVHLNSGLPRAEGAIVDAFGSLAHELKAEGPHPAELSRKVLALFAGRLAWHGRRDLDADVVLDDHDDDDTLLNALAELLWDARHVPEPAKEVYDG